MTKFGVGPEGLACPFLCGNCFVHLFDITNSERKKKSLHEKTSASIFLRVAPAMTKSEENRMLGPTANGIEGAAKDSLEEIIAKSPQISIPYL
jgi:hypothetical protein